MFVSQESKRENRSVSLLHHPLLCKKVVGLYPAAGCCLTETESRREGKVIFVFAEKVLVCQLSSWDNTDLQEICLGETCVVPVAEGAQALRSAFPRFWCVSWPGLWLCQRQDSSDTVVQGKRKKSGLMCGGIERAMFMSSSQKWSYREHNIHKEKKKAEREQYHNYHLWRHLTHATHFSVNERNKCQN